MSSVASAGLLNLRFGLPRYLPALSQARISQIENGNATSLETLRAYVAGLGGHLDIVARIGNIHLNVA